MIILLSPAKTLDYKTPSPFDTFTEPVFPNETKTLINELAKYSVKDLEGLMGISPDLAKLNHDRYKQLKENSDEMPLKQAVATFTGEAYRGLDVSSYDNDDADFAQTHLRILSGFYGILKPLDLIYPHRLEMGTNIKINTHKNLYDYWGDKITEQINKDLKEPKTIINLASQEYFKAVKKNKLNANVITLKFLDNKNGKYKTISVYAKNSRGAMTSWIIKNKISNPELIKESNVNNYQYNSDMSDKNMWVFTR